MRGSDDVKLYESGHEHSSDYFTYNIQTKSQPSLNWYWFFNDIFHNFGDGMIMKFCIIFGIVIICIHLGAKNTIEFVGTEK